jgi:Reverse transcriptase (RNA-dependent DNA polymerase)
LWTNDNDKSPWVVQQSFFVKAGVPQGGSLSSILFILYNAELVEMCTDPLLKTSSLAFVDDLNILVYSGKLQKAGKSPRQMPRMGKKTWSEIFPRKVRTYPLYKVED